MANPEHVKIVKQGAEALWEWRGKHRGVRLDLSKADLREADWNSAMLPAMHVHGADMRGVNLTGVSCSALNAKGADLTGANLHGAHLMFSSLEDANLSDACLQQTYLHGVTVTGAVLRGTDIRTTVFSSMDMSGVDFAGADLGATVFSEVNLAGACGLTETVHHGPSTVGVDTLLKSRGKIPAAFLRGCGVPAIWIEYLPSLTGKAIEFYSCFISHSSKDAEFARRLHERMQGEGLRVWYAPEDMKGGQRTIDQIDRAIRVYDKFLLVLSEESIASDWVRTEIRLARKREKEQGRQLLFPIRLVSVEVIKAWECFDSDLGRDLAADVREYHIPDFSNWKDHDSFEKGFKDLLRDLRKGEEKT